MRLFCIRLSQIAALLLLALLVGGLGWTIYATIRQERLNHALIAAIKQNDTKKALALLAEGADPNARDIPPQNLSFWRLILDRLRGRRLAPLKAPTALLVALDIRYFHGSLQFLPQDAVLIEALLDKGADPNVTNEEEETPLLLTVEAGAPANVREAASTLDKIILLLLKHGANVNQSNSVLFWALQNENIGDEIVVAILDRGANVNVRWYGGMTPLMSAIMQQRVEIVKKILAYHPNLNRIHLSDAKDLTSTNKGRQVIQMLKQAGAKE